MSGRTRKNLIEQNNELAQLPKNKLEDPSVSDETKNGVRGILGSTDDERRMEEGSN